MRTTTRLLAVHVRCVNNFGDGCVCPVRLAYVHVMTMCGRADVLWGRCSWWRPPAPLWRPQTCGGRWRVTCVVCLIRPIGHTCPRPRSLSLFRLASLREGARFFVCCARLRACARRVISIYTQNVLQVISLPCPLPFASHYILLEPPPSAPPTPPQPPPHVTQHDGRHPTATLQRCALDPRQRTAHSALLRTTSAADALHL